jgi:hypothetical protein
VVALRHRLIDLCIGFTLVVVLAFSGSAPAFADSTTATLSVNGGSLTEVNATTPTPSVTLNGTDQTVTYTLAITATDATGSGAGWNLTITSTQFSTGGGTPKTLATNASTITGVTAACVGGSTCTNPTNSVTYPAAVPAGGTAPTAVEFFNAAASSGMGKFTITPTVAIAIPANTFAGTYTSTITLAAVSGP